MKQFQLDSSMTTLRGVFYPTGYMVLMFPTENDAQQAARSLQDAGIAGDTISLLTPEVFQEQIVRSVGNADIPLPSAGTEADTVRRFAEYASQGHHALMVHAPSGGDGDRVMEILKDAPISYGQKYRKLVIEDVVD